MKNLAKISCLLMLAVLASCGARKSEAYYNYESKIIGTELDGSYTIRAYGRARNAIDSYEQAKKQAARDVIFKGVQSANSNIKSLKPLLMEVNAEEKYETYFNAFFADGGEYTKFVSMKEKRALSTNWNRTDAQSTAQATVCVFRDKLKQKLIEDGILKK